MNSKVLQIIICFALVLKVSSSLGQQTSWTGVTSVNWAIATNWTNGVPSAITDVIIGDANFTGAFQPAISASSTAKSLTVGGAVTSQLTVASTLTVKGNININSNGNIVHGSASISLTGDWTNEGAYSTTSGNATVIFAGLLQTLGGSVKTTFRRLTINRGSILSLNSNVDCTGTSSVLNVIGTLNPSEPITYLVTADSLMVNSSAVLKVTASTFNLNYQVSKPVSLNAGSIVEYASTLIDQTVSSDFTYSTLRISGAGKVKSLSADLPLLRSTSSGVGYIYVVAGTLDLGNYSANRGTTVAGGTLSVSNGAFLKIGGTNSFPTGFTTNALSLTSTVEYNGGNQAISAKTYGNLIFSSSAGAAVKTMPATAFTVSGSLTSNVGSGTSVSFVAAAIITITGSVNIGASTSFDGGSYTHSITGNWNNNGTFIPGTSTIYMRGANAIIGGSPVQYFNNLTIYGSNISAPAVTSLNISGNLATTSAGSFNQPSPGTLTMNGSAKTITGINITLNNLNVTGVVTSSATAAIGGDLNVSNSFITTGGTITMNGTGKTLTNSGTLKMVTFKITGSVATSSDFTISSTLTNTGSFTAPAGTITFAGSTILNGIVALYNITITGSYLRLAANSNLGISNALTTTGTAYLRTTSYAPNTVNYNGAQPQLIKNATYNNLILSNGNVKTAQGAIIVNNALTISPSTTFDAGSFSHTVYGNWVNNGSFIANTSTVLFRGATNTTISGATTFNTLKLYKTAATNTVTLLQNIEASTVDMYRGTLKTGSKILTITNTRLNYGVILGTITRTHTFLANTAYAFESAYSTVKFGTVSGVTSVTVNTTLGNVNDFPNGGAIGRVYTITIPSGTYTSATLRLHYEDAELNGNDETKMQLWRYNGTAWVVSGKTSNHTYYNYVEKTGISDITNRWSFTDDGSVLAWNGSVNSDWNTSGNWTLVQGVFSGVPGATDIVQIGKILFTNQPVISTVVKVKGIIMGSAQNVLLSLSTGGTLTVDGTMQGSWSSNASHVIQANNLSITVNGDLLLSDGTNGHAIDMNMGTGTLIVSGSLVQSGNANISFSGSGALKIGQDFTYTSGTFSPGTSTVTYIGAESQLVAAVPYYNLTITKTTGTSANISDLTSIAGNLSVTSGELDMYNTANISGSVSITGSAILETDSSFIKVGGNWNLAATATFNSGDGSVLFNGTGSQTISSAAFNNLSIDKTSGLASLSGDINVDEDLALLAGTFNLSTYSINDTTSGNLFSMVDGTFLNVSGANNFPANFTSYNLGNNSTVTYDGAVAQSVGDVTYGNITFSNGAALSKTLLGSSTINGNITINSGASLDAGTYNLTLLGNWNNSGNFIASTSTIFLNGGISGANNLVNGPTTFYNFIVNGFYALTPGSNLIFLGDFEVSGFLESGFSNKTFYGNSTVSGVASDDGISTFMGNQIQYLRYTGSFYSPNYTSSVVFKGTVAPISQSTTPPIFINLEMSNTSPTGLISDVDMTVLGTFLLSPGCIWNGANLHHTFMGSFTNNGTLLSDGILTFAPGPPLTYTPSNTIHIGSGSNFQSTGTVEFAGASQLIIDGTPSSFNDIIISNTNSAGITAPSAWNMTGKLAIYANSVFNAGSFSHLVAGDIESDGTLNGNTSTVTMSSPTGQLDGSPETVFNNFKITGDVTANSDFNVAGNFTNNGSYDGTIGALIMNGNNNSVIDGTTIPSSIAQLTIGKDSGVTVTANVDINSVSALIVNSGIFFTSTRTISQSGVGGALVVMGGATLKIGGINTLPAFSGYGLDEKSTVEYAGTVQTIAQAGSGYGNLVISAAGNKTATSFVPLTIAGDLKITAGNFVANNNTHKLGGNWIMTGGTFTNTNSIIQFNGLQDQKIQTIAPFNSITINKLAGVVNLSNDVTVNNIATFTKGNIQTGNYKVIIPATGSVSGAGQSKGWVNGNLQKNVVTGASVSRTFEVEDSAYYTPSTLLFSNVNIVGNFIAKATPSDHPEADYSGVDTTKSVNRYWTLTNGGVGFTSATATFNWVPTDVDAGANTSNFKTVAFDGTNWLLNSVSNPLSTSIKPTGLTGFGAFQVGESITRFKWTGGAMTSDWNAKGNWTGGVPTTALNSLIPSGLSGGILYPSLQSGYGIVKDLIIESTAVLTVSDGNLQITGAITNSGTFDATNGTIEMKGSSAQTIAGSMFTKKTIKNLVVSNTGTGVSVSSAANDTLKITGTLSFGNSSSTLNTGDNITLVSDSNGTANVGVVGSGNAIIGKVIVERYINTGTSVGQHGKSWQFLSTPVIGQTVKESWMENGSTDSTGYGTQITGAGGTAAGFDAATTTPSIKTYIAATDSWTGVTNANNALYNPKGYMVFVRGDKGVTVYNQPANTTTLRTKGTLLTGSLSPISLTPGKMESVGNPYASRIDFTSITKDAGIDDKFYVWDPYLYGSYGLGGYQTTSSANNWEPVPGGTNSYPTGVSNRTIHSGQAFFVHATPNAIPGYTLTFNEDCKAGNGSSPNFTRQMNRTSGQRQYFRASLFTAPDGIMADGNTVAFDRSFSNAIDGNDAIKIMNSGENFGLKRAGNLLSIEAKGPVSSTDTIYYYLSNLKARGYQLRFAPVNMDGSGLEAYLLDQFLNTSTPISLTDSSNVNINVTGNAASSATGRFKVVFRTMSALPVTVTSIKAYTKEKNIAVEWTVENEKDLLQYEVEKSVDGMKYVQTAIVPALNKNTGNYVWTDQQSLPGNNFYRIFIKSRNGSSNYTEVVKVSKNFNESGLSVNPNPIVNNSINLLLTNQPAGNYGVRLINSLGEVIVVKNITHTGGNNLQKIEVTGNALPKGIYELEVMKPQGSKEAIKILK